MIQNYILKKVNLSLSFLCDANCIFCPEDRGKRLKTKIMDPQIVEKIVREVSSNPKLHSITHFECGENGEAFLNPNALECLRTIKGCLPKCTIRIFTNFRHLTRDKAAAILQEGLADAICCNIDGHNDKYYRAVKGRGLKKVEQNLMDFLEIRKSLHSNVPLTIYAITYRQYVDTIRNNFGFLPRKLHGKELGIEDDFALIKARWEPFINIEKDSITRNDFVVSWAERPMINPSLLSYDKYECPNLERVKHEAFIAPDGTWYACCLDSNNELVLGNLAHDSLANLMEGDRRVELIRMLEKREFSKIGGPCRTVNCCQWLHKLKIANTLRGSIFSHHEVLLRMFDKLLNLARL